MQNAPTWIARIGLVLPLGHESCEGSSSWSCLRVPHVSRFDSSLGSGSIAYPRTIFFVVRTHTPQAGAAASIDNARSLHTVTKQAPILTFDAREQALLAGHWKGACHEWLPVVNLTRVSCVRR